MVDAFLQKEGVFTTKMLRSSSEIGIEEKAMVTHRFPSHHNSCSTVVHIVQGIDSRYTFVFPFSLVIQFLIITQIENQDICFFDFIKPGNNSINISFIYLFCS